MSRPNNRQQLAAAAAMSGAVDLTVLKERAEAAAKAAAAPRPAAGSGAGGASASTAVVEVTEASFEAEVISRSTTQLVIVELWASWSGECAKLSPVLEALAERSAGRWTLARVDIEAQPRIAQAFGVQSVPMVVALAGGRPVDAFAEVLPPAQISSWIDGILAQVGGALPDSAATDAAGEAEQIDPRMQAAEDSLNAGDLDGALAAYRTIVAAEPGNAEAASAVRFLEFQLRAQAHDPEIVVTAADHDVDAQLAAADVLLLGQRPEAAFDRIIALIAATRDDDRDRARTRLLSLFELFDPAEPFVVAARRKLATALY